MFAVLAAATGIVVWATVDKSPAAVRPPLLRAVPSDAMFVHLNAAWAGLMNQHITLVAALTEARRRGVAEVHLGPFRTDLLAGTLAPASRVLDLAALGRQFGLVVRDAPSPADIYPPEQRYAFEDLAFAHLRTALPWRPVAPPPPPEPAPQRWAVVHLKTGADSHAHYARVHGVAPAAFEARLRAHYRARLAKGLAASGVDHVFVCVGDKADPLLAFLRAAGVTVAVSPPLRGPDPGRELRALQDLQAVLARFRGAAWALLNCDVAAGRGSSFSTYLHHHGDFVARDYVHLDDWAALAVPERP